MMLIIMIMTRYHFILIIAVISKHLITRIRINRIEFKQRKKISFRKKILFDQSEIIENKEIKFFLEKTNNSKMILKRTTSIEFNTRLNERFKRLIERRMNES